jgi:serine O-acetyltransferase
MSCNELTDVVKAIAKSYTSEEVYAQDSHRYFPNRDVVINIIKELRCVMFPRYYGDRSSTGTAPEYYIGNTLSRIERDLDRQMFEAFMFRDGAVKDKQEIGDLTERICREFIMKLPEIQKMLLKDVQAAFDGDPAAQSKEEIIFSYPGFFAILVYRMAHELYIRDVPLLPRIMSEYAHSISGVDINPGAEIGEYFFIDHATGVVIGETTKIGDHVKVYQGVTLGALSTRAGQKLRGKKRHPTIEDDVTIYSNASILGGETVIGKGSIIAGSAFVTSSVPPNSRVTVKGNEIAVREGGKKHPDDSIERPN